MNTHQSIRRVGIQTADEAAALAAHLVAARVWFEVEPWDKDSAIFGEIAVMADQLREVERFLTPAAGDTKHAVGDLLDGLKVHDLAGDGTPIRFDRRRYGRTTYCWAEAWVGGCWQSLGDPWPTTRPKRSEVESAIESRRRAASRAYVALRASN